MNRSLPSSSENCRPEASVQGERNVLPFFPARAAQDAARMGQQADLWALADGWNFRLLV